MVARNNLTGEYEIVTENKVVVCNVYYDYSCTYVEEYTCGHRVIIDTDDSTDDDNYFLFADGHIEYVDPDEDDYSPEYEAVSKWSNLQIRNIKNLDTDIQNTLADLKNKHFNEVCYTLCVDSTSIKMHYINDICCGCKESQHHMNDRVTHGLSAFNRCKNVDEIRDRLNFVLNNKTTEICCTSNNFCGPIGVSGYGNITACFHTDVWSQVSDNGKRIIDFDKLDNSSDHNEYWVTEMKPDTLWVKNWFWKDKYPQEQELIKQMAADANLKLLLVSKEVEDEMQKKNWKPKYDKYGKEIFYWCTEDVITMDTEEAIDFLQKVGWKFKKEEDTTILKIKGEKYITCVKYDKEYRQYVLIVTDFSNDSQNTVTYNCYNYDEIWGYADIPEYKKNKANEQISAIKNTIENGVKIQF